MTGSKSTEERRKEIVGAAWQLFITKGYEQTSTVDIMNAVGIAKGTLYYHFSSKEEILDALIEEVTDQMETAARPLGEDHNIPIPDRIIGVIRAINIAGAGENGIIDALHLPHNALFHQKSHALTIDKISPIMLMIVEDGIRQGLFHTDYPESAVHMALSYSLTGFDSEQSQSPAMIKGFIYHLERMLGTGEGELSKLIELFD